MSSQLDANIIALQMGDIKVMASTFSLALLHDETLPVIIFEPELCHAGEAEASSKYCILDGMRRCHVPLNVPGSSLEKAQAIFLLKRSDMAQDGLSNVDKP